MGIYGPPGLNGWISDMYDLNPTRLDTLDGHNGHGHCGLSGGLTLLQCRQNASMQSPEWQSFSVSSLCQLGRLMGAVLDTHCLVDTITWRGNHFLSLSSLPWHKGLCILNFHYRVFRYGRPPKNLKCQIVRTKMAESQSSPPYFQMQRFRRMYLWEQDIH